MKYRLVWLLSGFLGCDHPVAAQKRGAGFPEKALLSVAASIEGNFDGDRQRDTATVVQTHTGSGNPVENGTPGAYEVRFSGKKLPAIPIGCCHPTLINEGDLTGDGLEELSIFQEPMNGCTATLTTYTFSLKKQMWQRFLGPLLIPTGCEPLSPTALQDRIFKKADAVYYYEADPNSEKKTLIKRKIQMR